MGGIHSMRVVMNAYGNSMGKPLDKESSPGGRRCDVTRIRALDISSSSRGQLRGVREHKAVL
jgi:hypothetical protein